jgi:hypothetical protein
VEHPCLRCQGPVEDSSPFCPHCGAAQVRFAGPASPRDPVAIAIDTPTSSPAASAFETSYSAQVTARPATRLGLRAALTAGVIAAVLSSMPLGPAFVFALPIGGFLAVLFYRRWSSVREEPSSGMGFRLGGLSGLFAFGTFVVLTAFETLVFGGQNELREALVRAVRQAQTRSSDPQARQMMEYFLTPQGLVWMVILGLIFLAITFVLLSAIGGAVSAALLGRKPPPDR